MPPAIPGLGTRAASRSGCRIAAAASIEFLDQNVQKFLAAARKRPELAGRQLARSAPRVPQVFADVDRDKVLKQGVALGDVYQTLRRSSAART